MIRRARRLLLRVSPFVWLGLAIALVLPWYIRYSAWGMGTCGVATFAPIP